MRIKNFFNSIYWHEDYIQKTFVDIYVMSDAYKNLCLSVSNVILTINESSQSVPLSIAPPIFCFSLFLIKTGNLST